jgi:DNA-nicking Smr family endonuclease
VVKKVLSNKDSALFRQTVGQVNTVNQDKVLLNPKTKERSQPYDRDTVQPLLIAKQPLSAKDSLSFLATGLSTDVLKKLRQGYFSVEAELDLHGLTSMEAKQQLHRFLQDCIEASCQCVHIIHGKGYRSADHYPILKNNLNNWLRLHKAILAFCSASAKDGGTGAVWVLLDIMGNNY